MLERKLSWFWSLGSLLSLIGIGLVFRHAFSTMDYDWNFGVLVDYIWDAKTGEPGLILKGLWGTLYISLTSVLIGSVLGTAIGIVIHLREPVAKAALVAYIDFFRNTPVLVQLYVAYFVIGTAFGLSPNGAGILTLSLFCSAYVADLVRGTLAHFNRGQIDAGKSLGMSSAQIGIHIVAPQAAKQMLPALVGLFVTLVKDSSLVSVIGILDLTKSSLNVVAVTFRSFETWFFVAAIYLGLNLLVSSFGRYLEYRLATGEAR